MPSRLPLVLLALIGSCLADNTTPLSSTPAATSQVTTTQGAVPSTTASQSVVTTAAPQPLDHNLYHVILHAENPSGLLENGQPCSDFSFAGMQCSLYFKYNLTSGTNVDNGTPLSSTPAATSQVTTTQGNASFSYGNSGDNHDSHSLLLDGDSFTGFKIQGSLYQNNGNVATDPLVVTFSEQTVDPSYPQGVMTLFDIQSGASVRFAWKTALSAPVTTPQPTTAQTTTPATGVTATDGTTTNATAGTTPAPYYPRDCDEYIGQDRVTGNRTIYINGNITKPVMVYCEFGSSGALTTIQSRGDLNPDAVFSDNASDYNAAIGVPGVGNNHWIGLDNMNAITSGDTVYNLYVEVCCGGAGQQQIYHNFSIGAGPNYRLNATADTPSIGLDLYSVGSANAKDIGQPFTTRNNIKAVAGIDPDDCEILDKYNTDFDKVVSQGSGGWWFGSCANNLNGGFIGKASSLDINCTMTPSYPTNTTGTGIALRTTPGATDEFNDYMDKRSYTRVRMAVFRNDRPLQGISTSAFCAGSP